MVSVKSAFELKSCACAYTVDCRLPFLHLKLHE